MSTLQDLPLELFRLIIQHVAGYPGFAEPRGGLTTNVDLRPAVRLRLVSKRFDREVMCDIASRNLILANDWYHMAPSEVCRFTWRWWEGCWRLNDWFNARYLCGRPQPQQPWNGNVSALFNYLLDEIYSRESGQYSPEHRYKDMYRLCKSTFRFRRNVGDFGDPPATHGMIFWLFPRTTPVTRLSQDLAIIAAQMLLGRNRQVMEFIDTCAPEVLTIQDEVFGTFLETAIRTGNLSLVANILARGIDVSDDRHRALQIALENDDIHMVNLILTPQYGYPTSGLRFEKFVIKAIHQCRSEIAHFLLDRSCKGPLPYVAHDGLLYACSRGDKSIVEKLLHRYPDTDIGSNRWYRSVWTHAAICRAADSRNLKLVQFLLHRGANPWGQPGLRSRDIPHAKEWFREWNISHGTAMHFAALHGEIKIANALLDAGYWLAPEKWMDIIKVASLRHQDGFIKYLIDGIFDVRSIADTQPDMIRSLVDMFCWQGNDNGIRLLASYGIPMDGEFYHGRSTPMDEAVYHKRRNVAIALVEVGAEEVIDINRVAQEERFYLKWPEYMFQRI